ncbi:MAG: ATP-binding protein [Flavobacteriales bacterium]|nr:ATP-binding protein [Flavobacteriales bacterium]
MVSIVLRNLISNALKYTNLKGLVQISSKKQEHELIISINDNGVGIAKELMDKLFQIDGVISTPGTQKEKGTGLGLILCREYLGKNKGKIWVQSEVNEGTTFYFSLPLND